MNVLKGSVYLNNIVVEIFFQLFEFGVKTQFNSKQLFESKFILEPEPDS